MAHAIHIRLTGSPEVLNWSVMVGVVALAVLGMTATLAGAQPVGVKEKPPLYLYVSYWAFPRAHWADADKDNATASQKILALADGTHVGYGDDENQVHSADSFTHDNWWQANSIAGLMKALEAFHKSGGWSSPLLVSSTRHWDQISIVEYETEREMIHTTDSPAQLHFGFVMPSAEGLDEFRAALGAALDENSLIGPAFGSMMVNFTPQADLVRVSATYR
jgi:hypothetical protein